MELLRRGGEVGRWGRCGDQNRLHDKVRMLAMPLGTHPDRS